MEAQDWTQGVLYGASMASQTTAAATGAVGVLRRDPMAMLPFCGYNICDYFGHWLAMAEMLPLLPKVFSVNWFRQDEQGKYIWPGFGTNIHVIKWISERVSGAVDVTATPVGNLPLRSDLAFDDIEITEEAIQLLTSIDSAAWAHELNAIIEFFRSLGDNVPEKLYDRVNALKGDLG
jgi:phosphoenolpyruvate carboxykinase (GTP)